MLGKSNGRRSKGSGITVLLLALFLTQNCLAGNGISLIGFGPDSVAMGSADLTTVDDTNALNINPAALTKIENSQVDIYFASATDVNSNHKDMFGNDIDDIVTGGAFIDLGYAHKIDEQLAWGIGFFVQGGVGVALDDLNTAFGTQDDISVQTRIVRLTPGLAWKVNEKLSFGVTAIFTYADTEQKFFPNTSFNNAGQNFFGQQVKDMTAQDLSFLMGLSYDLNATTTIAFSFATEVDLALDGGKAIFDMSAIGLNKVTYNKVNIESINLPQQLGIGISHLHDNGWLVAAEINWLNWRNAARATSLTAKNPDNPNAPSVINSSMLLEWEDQYVFALGARYHLDNQHNFMMGINLANNPVPTENMSPITSAIATKHITMGYSFPWNLNSSLHFAAEYQLPAKKTYTNPNQLFGEDTFIEFSVLILYFMYSHNW
ncbi:hypothetical protein MNBD_GAMMA05-2587 [hydrothermal vent metagenome]|uniref:Long-chain fatty acid transport protein n=1 Tax=hydrothermal vent metagenome TaxID=652676 RepID=A0A3B0WMS6_9ZZZZ